MTLTRHYLLTFVAFTLLFGVYFIYATPPGQGADERNHIARAWSISTGELFPSTEGNRRGGEVPNSIRHLQYAYWGLRFDWDRKIARDSSDFFAAMPLRPDLTTFHDYPNTAVYPWIVYAPAATGLAVARVLDLSVLGTMRAARWAGLLFWLVTGAFALWLLPAWRGLFTALLLLPMTVWTHAMISADTVTNAVAFITVAYILRRAFGERRNVGPRQLATLAGLAFLLASAKLVYVPLLLLSVLIPAKRFTTVGGKWLAAALVGGVALATLLYWSNESGKIYLPYAEYSEEHREPYVGLKANANMHEHRKLVVDAPYRLFRAAGNSVLDTGHFYVRAYVGILGWLDTWMPKWFYWFAYVYLFAMALTARVTTWSTRLVSTLSFVLCYLLVTLSQLLSWEPVGSHTIVDFQGRYLVPMAPLFFLLFPVKPWRHPARRWVISGASLLLLLVAAYKIVDRYYV